MQLFYNENISSHDTLISFDKEESRHIVRVLRKNIGDTLIITNGKGSVFRSEIISVDQRSVQVKILEERTQPQPSYQLHMAVAPTKNIDRFEWFLEKATEIGISQITPIICERSERKVVKLERLRRIILNAAKQSLKYHLPRLNEPVMINDLMTEAKETSKYIAHCEETSRQSLFKSVSAGENAIVLIGPEGDFSVKEITMALEQGFIPVTLGESRLRTETAAVAACHTFALLNEK
ncbi:16S rRNA (uracil(1498)-N(3))-methyltransferase [Winogradskyella aurantiaca]|uniref:16S rRNA (uracil(1498)-N(3))-methyltransferase n=1 Tax=Winogradskyella aurantiaca TaxID=2219558 RepID=UPI000E1D3359|nr:16S rRNA (uracil(1498)-N(3))-methyltransferase [Winogradskyella aurantiaca]